MPKVNLDTSKALHYLHAANEAMEVVESSDDPTTVAEAADVVRQSAQDLALESVEVFAVAELLATISH